MTKTQFWILNAVVVLYGVLFITESLLSRQVGENERTLAAMQRIAQDGATYSSKWEQLAIRTYQMSQQAPELKDVLAHQHINIAPKAAANATPVPSTEGSAPLVPPAK
jgi:hypothetical protein